MLPLKKYILPLLLLLLIKQDFYGQTAKTNRLFALLKTAATPQQRLDGILALCAEYQSLNRDTLYSLALEARQLAGLQPDAEKKALAGMALADAYMQWGWADSALAVFPDLQNCEQYFKTDLCYNMLRHRAMIYAGHADYAQALDILFPALAGAEKAKDTLNQAAIMNSIGSINLGMEKNAEGLGWIHKAAAVCAGTPRCQSVLAAVYTNAANAYSAAGTGDSAIYFIQRALPLARQSENLFVLATALRIHSVLLTRQQKFAEAETALKEMLEIRKQTSGEDLFVEDNLQLADFYAGSGQLDKAIAVCTTMLGHTGADSGRTTVTDPKIKLEYWQALAGYYKQAGRGAGYQQALEQVVSLKDSMYAANQTKAIADAEVKYKAEKNQNTILRQKYSLQRSRMLLYLALGLLTLATAIAWFIFRDIRRRQRLKMEIALAREKASAEAAVKIAGEKERLRIAADLHDNIGAYASAMRADVESLLDGQTAGEESLLNLRQHSQEIMNSLRDTIWALNREDITITGISDRIKNYVSKLQPSYNRIQFNISETVTNDISIHSQTALNIFRIVQEAVHNALKHSGATRINIAINSSGPVWITVTDNGKGIEQPASGGGNGLTNMAARAAESGLQFGIESGSQSGTTITVKIPTSN